MAYGIYPMYQQQGAAPKPQASDMFTTAAPQPLASPTAVAQDAQPNRTSAALGAPAPAAPASSPFGGTPGAGPFGPAATPGGFEQLLASAQPARAQNAAGAQQAISDMLMAPTEPSRESAAARSAFIKAQAEAGRENREASAGAGRLATGQLGGDVARFNDKALGQRADLENQLAIADGNRADTNRRDGLSAFLSFEGLGEQSRNSQAQLGLEERRLGESARQFDTQQAFQTWATQEGWNQDAIARAWQSRESAAERASREGIAFAGLSLQEKQLAQEASQFSSRLDFDRWATQAGLDAQTAQRIWQSLENEKARTSTEKIAFAGLAQEDRQLAQQAMQFASKLDFDKSALAAQMDEAQRQRIWQAVESEKARASTEKIAFAGLDLQERELAQAGMQFDRKQDFDRWALTQQLDDAQADRIWRSIEAEKARTFEGSESALDRALSSSQFAERLGLDQAQLTEQIRQFNSREEFDRWAKGVDVDEAERARVWEGVQADVQRQWQSGERLSSQDHEILLEKLQEDSQIRVMERNQVLNLQTLEQQQAHDEKILGLQNTYDTMRMREGFSHEESMANLEGQIQAMLSAQGYSQEQALQGARLEVQRIEGERSRALEERIAFAQLASTSSIALQELGLKREQLTMAREELRADIENNAAVLGLRREEFELLKDNQEFNRALETAAVLTEKWGDNPDTQAKAAEILFSSLRQTEPPMISEDQYRSGILTAKLSTFKDPAQREAWALANGYSAEEVSAAIRAIPPAPPGPSNAPDDVLKRGINNIGEGNILTGAGQVVGGVVGGLGDAVSDTASGVADAGRTVKRIFGRLF